jgi:hypothetical protein
MTRSTRDPIPIELTSRCLNNAINCSKPLTEDGRCENIIMDRFESLSAGLYARCVLPVKHIFIYSATLIREP